MHRLSPVKINISTETEKKHRKRSCPRNKSSSHVLCSTPIKAIPQKNARVVQVRVVFIRIGEIDTLNEKYQADVYYEARWMEKMNMLNLTSEEQTQILNDNCSMKTDNVNSTIPWTPKLFIENEIGRIGNEEKWFTIKRDIEENKQQTVSSSSSIVNVNICEHRRLKGIFWEKLELNHFPADVQDLTISITTNHLIENCTLTPDEKLRSSINREAFSDQQEWKLYEHVALGLRQTQEEYSFQDEDCETKLKQHPVLSVTCRAARRPGYYYWNGFCLIFMITLCSFCIFSIPPDLPQSRLQITCTLLLTSVTFRWVVNRSLPTISYLTTLDKYAIISIIILVVLCLWHSIIAAIIFLNPGTAVLKSVEPTNIYVIIDRYMFVSMFVIYILMHLLLIVWLIFVPYRRRREMEYFDREYAAKKHIQFETTRVRYNSIQMQPQDFVFRHGSNTSGNQSIVKSPLRSIKHSDGVMIMPNAGVFLPIREETTNETSFQTINSMEIHEQDDVFYDNINENKSSQI